MKQRKPSLSTILTFGRTCNWYSGLDLQNWKYLCRRQRQQSDTTNHFTPCAMTYYVIFTTRSFLASSWYGESLLCLGYIQPLPCWNWLTTSLVYTQAPFNDVHRNTREPRINHIHNSKWKALGMACIVYRLKPGMRKGGSIPTFVAVLARVSILYLAIQVC